MRYEPRDIGTLTILLFLSLVFCIMTSQEKTEEHPFVDIFNEDEAEKNFMLSKPVCFVVFGKPVTLPILEEHIASETESGVMLQSMLIRGQSIPDELVTKLILEKLNSPEVSHFGYIITEMPSLSQDAMTTLQQIELIRKLNLKPDIIINIKCPDYDLCQRISGQRQHDTTGYIYTSDQWDPEVIEKRRKKKKDAQKEGKGEEDGEEEEEQEEEAFIAEMQMVAEILQHLVQRPEDYLENIEHTVKLYKDIILHPLEEIMAEHNSQYLIELDGNKPPEELFRTVMDQLKYLNLQRAAVLTKLQSAEEEINDTMENTGERTHGAVSGNLLSAEDNSLEDPRLEELWQKAKTSGKFNEELDKLATHFEAKIEKHNQYQKQLEISHQKLKYEESFGYRECVIKSKERDAMLEKKTEEMGYKDELFHALASYKLIAPRYRWQRSRWGRTCPVALKEGNIFQGMPDFSVSFLGKIYCLSSEEAFKTFLLNPRPYLLPPMPAPPFKVFIFGPQSSGKTTLSNLLAKHYKGKVVDYNKLVQPRFDEALEILTRNTIAEATEAAIKVVKEKLTELQAKRQVDTANYYLLAQSTSEDPQGEFERRYVFPTGIYKSTEELQSSLEDVFTHESQRKSSLEDSEGAGMKSYDKDDEKETLEMSTFKRSLQDSSQDLKLDSKKEYTIEEVTADHPEVLSIIKETVKVAKDMYLQQPYEKHAEILEEVLQEVVEENKNRFHGAPKYGGWILDNCPIVRELWMVLADKGILPDLVICLSDTENNGKYLLNRLYLENKPEIDSKILGRLLGELLKKKKEEESERKAAEEQRLKEENQRLLETMNAKAKGKHKIDVIHNVSFNFVLGLLSAFLLGMNPWAETEAEAEEEIEGEESELHEGSVAGEVAKETGGSLPEEPDVFELPGTEHESVSEPAEDITVGTEIPKGSKEDLATQELFETVVLPEFPEDAYPDVPEMEPIKEKITFFTFAWKLLETTINDSSAQILHLEIADKTPEELLQKVVETMEKPFQYAGWELTMEDYDEETEDYQAEADADEELEEEEEDEEENEDRIKEKKRHLGDTKHFCPVALKENFILQPGSVEEAAKYRERIYYFSSPEAKEKFLEQPEVYVAHEEPLKAPPLRICLLGPRGSGKTVCGRHLAEKFGIFHIQFEQFLQEKLMLKTEKKIGPEYEDDSEEEQFAKQELEELAIQANVTIEEENMKKLPHEVQFTEEEEAIRLNLTENEPLPPEILEGILSEWWFKEPIRYLIYGFPRYPDEVEFLGEHGFFPDAAVFIQVDDRDISDRLLPTQIGKWKVKQQRKLERKKLIKEMKAKIKENMISKRRAELIIEREKKRKGGETVREDEDISEEDPEEDTDDIENILEDEFPKDEEVMSEEDEEQEIDALERLRSELREKFEADMSNLQIIQEEFEKFLVPVMLINGARKIHIVQYMLNTKLKPLVENRASIFEKCYPISSRLAQKMLSFTYKYISSFGYWDPVKLSEGETIKPIENSENPLYPVIHRQYIYFLSSKETKEKFMKNPIKYIRQPKPKPTMPIRIAILGPPKSGKTTVAKKMSSEYGLKHLSIGEALRYVLSNQPDTELALMLNWHLHKGRTAPDELALQALELSLMGSTCNTAGVVIDGYPVTKYQVSLLEARSVIPMVIFELDVPSKEIFKRLLLEKKTEPSLPYPLHNSSQIIAVKNSKYRKNIDEIRQYYQEQHQNWYVIDGFHSKWWVWNEVIKKVQMMNKHVHIYLERIKAGKAACIDKLCISPEELISRLGEFGQYCPVSLAESYELVDCSVTDSLEFAAEFRGHYYKMSSQEKLNKFLENPELYVPPLAPHPLPSAEMIPKRLTLSELKSRFPKCAELQGYCPVTYKDGKQRQVLTLVQVQNDSSTRTFNPKSSEYTRKKYKKKMEQFMERCELITYLGAKMTRKYKEPQFRAIDFDHKLQTFLSLRNKDPVNG
ncbi:Adenylate kinase 9 [Camelus dromedarius]|uniref:Adenylate kinase 9 n=1 Tax=Camelus dromedarius TaxID=9838 RepID=A0A5N4DWY9_CAMDR|nr:Adenylate kinase 9 [Camelus dromedarius]